MILKDLSIVINSVDHSSSLRALTMTETVAQQPATAHGDTFEWFEAGLQAGNLSCDFWQDFTSGGVDDLFSPLLADADGFTVVIKPTSGSTSSTNPTFTATMNLASYERFSGEVGTRGICTAVFELAAGTGFVRADA